MSEAGSKTLHFQEKIFIVEAILHGVEAPLLLWIMSPSLSSTYLNLSPAGNDRSLFQVGLVCQYAMPASRCYFEISLLSLKINANSFMMFLIDLSA
jgi:hypothetical protein